MPVLDGDRLQGIVTRADLMRTIAARRSARIEPVFRTDEAIRESLLAELARQPWWKPCCSKVLVTAGVVEFRGFADTDAQMLAACVAAENIDGVVAVRDMRILTRELPAML